MATPNAGWDIEWLRLCRQLRIAPSVRTGEEIAARIAEMEQALEKAKPFVYRAVDHGYKGALECLHAINALLDGEAARKVLGEGK